VHVRIQGYGSVSRCHRTRTLTLFWRFKKRQFPIVNFCESTFTNLDPKHKVPVLVLVENKKYDLILVPLLSALPLGVNVSRTCSLKRATTEAGSTGIANGPPCSGVGLGEGSQSESLSLSLASLSLAECEICVLSMSTTFTIISMATRSLPPP